MFGTKVEIILPKAEPGHWAALNFPKKVTADETQIENTKQAEKDEEDSDVDLDDLEQVRGLKINEIKD